MRSLLSFLALCLAAPLALAQTPPTLEPVTPPEQRGSISAERLGIHDANRIRTWFYNYGMVGDYQTNPDLSVFHSVEVPKGSGLNYSDGISPFVLTRVIQENGNPTEIMETGFRERQAISPITDRTMRFEPRPGFAQPDPAINQARSIALSNDPRTWPDCWPDKANDPDDPGWCGSWNGFFGKRPNADQESFSVMDDNYYDAFNFFPDTRDRTRRGLGLRVEVRGFQWSNPQAQNVIFWHYDIVNESTTDYEDIVFGLYMDSGVGGSPRSCDGVAESDDDNAFYNRDFGLNLVYTWDRFGNGISLSGNCTPTGYLGYAYLETPGNPFNGADDDQDGIIDEQRDSGPGQRIDGQDAIRAYVNANYNLADFERTYGPLEERPPFAEGIWFTGDEDMDWVARFHDVGTDGVAETGDTGEGDGIPTRGEPNFDQTDINESDQIGLTGFRMNRIRAGAGAPSSETDNIVFFNNEREWARRLYEQFTDPDPAVRFDTPLALNYNIGFLFASGPFKLEAGRRERFSLALAYGGDLTELETNVNTVQSIYNANYQFATPPPAPTVTAIAGDETVTLSWDNVAERSVDPVSNRNDFEGYRIYRSTDPNFNDVRILNVRDTPSGRLVSGNGRPMEQFDLVNDVKGYSDITVEGIAYYLGNDTGIRHTFTDTDVVNGQTYYYAVTAYDTGSEEFGFYPSENAINVSRTLRGGTILPGNVVEVRPAPRVPGFVGATVDSTTIEQVTGTGTGNVRVVIANDDLVPDGDRFRLDFLGLADSVRARTYTLTNLATGEVVIEGGTDLDGAGTGPTGSGLLPIVSTLQTPRVDTLASGFTPTSLTNARLTAQYSQALPPNLRRPHYPESMTVTFANAPLDTSKAAIGAPAVPVNFKIVGDSGYQFDFRFRDVNGDRTLSADGEYIEVLTPRAENSNSVSPAWRINFDAERSDSVLVAPGEGSTYRLEIDAPFAAGDAYEFTTQSAFIDDDLARNVFADEEPYAVPNPYTGSASFEPDPFGVTGRGDRAMEFRAIPAGATLRIYTLRGDLVTTLQHDGSTAGTIRWDLRSKDNLSVAPGLYFFHVDAAGMGTFVGKFAIIK